MSAAKLWRPVAGPLVAVAILTSAGCGFRGLNSFPLPGTVGSGAGSYQVAAQLPDITNLQPNSPVMVGDVTVGSITKIQRQDWHALVTMRIRSGVELPANSVARVGQTSILGSLHVEVAPPQGAPAQGRLHDGSLIPLSSAMSYPTVEQTLAAVSVLLNNGGIGQIQDITEAFSTAFAGREQDLRSLIRQLAHFTSALDRQTGDIITATEKTNRLAARFADQKPVVDRALQTIPNALKILGDERSQFVDAVDLLGKLSALTADSVNKTKESLVAELEALGPVFDSLANAGPALTRSLSYLTTPPWVKETLPYWMRGDYGNATLILDMTLGRIDSNMFTGTRWEGNLTELEMQWGRTIGQLPSPYTAGNPVAIPYRTDQGR
jgi:phospholipid/cholesterol/gamma-HCH transport system substrate-binding protein